MFLPQVQKSKPWLPRFPGTASAPGSFNINGFIAHNTFFDSDKNPYSKPRISSDRFWSYQQRSYYSCVLYNQGRIFPIRGYNRDPKTWVLEWMTGNVHHEAKALDLIELIACPLQVNFMNLVVSFTAML